MDVEKYVAQYITLRDKKQAIVEEAKNKVSQIDNVMDRMEGELLKYFNSINADNVKTAAGTAFRARKTFANVKDWDAFTACVRENDAWHLLTKGVSKAAVEEWRAANGELPPGVDVREELTVNIRRS